MKNKPDGYADFESGTELGKEFARCKSDYNGNCNPKRKQFTYPDKGFGLFFTSHTVHF